MKKIFIGSSQEAIEHARVVSNALAELEGVEPILWENYFKNGDITLLGIERLADRIHGAVILATPDDRSVIREKSAMTPRANVLFEYGFLIAALGRERVALCRYDEVELPSDLNGLTWLPMGGFIRNQEPLVSGVSKLREWADCLDDCPIEVGATRLRHGLSGEWNCELTFDRWRKIDIRGEDFAVVEAKLLLDIPIDGQSGTGCAVGRLQVQIGSCFAEFHITDLVKRAECTNTGGLILRTETHSRQLTKEIVGVPPQTDGFEQSLRSAQSFQLSLEPHEKEPKVLVGRYETHFAGNLYSKATLRIWR